MAPPFVDNVGYKVEKKMNRKHFVKGEIGKDLFAVSVKCWLLAVCTQKKRKYGGVPNPFRQV